MAPGKSLTIQLNRHTPISATAIIITVTPTRTPRYGLRCSAGPC